MNFSIISTTFPHLLFQIIGVAFALFVVAFAAPEPKPQFLVPGVTAYSAYSAPLATYNTYSEYPYSAYSAVYPSVYGAVHPAAVIV